MLFRSGGHSTKNGFYPNIYDCKIHNMQNNKTNLQGLGRFFPNQGKYFLN